MSRPSLREKLLVMLHARQTNFRNICGLLQWYQCNCIWGSVWQHVNPKFNQGESNDSDG